MIEPDPDLFDLLNEIAVDGLPALSRQAQDAAFLPDGREDDTAERLVSDERSRDEQLDRASEYVVSTLEREIAATEKLGELTEKLQLKGVSVVRTTSVDGRPIAREEDLLSPARTKALRKLLDAWRSAEGQLRQAWNSPDGD
jgi:hypothetical protein